MPTSARIWRPCSAVRSTKTCSGENRSTRRLAVRNQVASAEVGAAIGAWHTSSRPCIPSGCSCPSHRCSRSAAANPVIMPNTIGFLARLSFRKFTTSSTARNSGRTICYGIRPIQPGQSPRRLLVIEGSDEVGKSSLLHYALEVCQLRRWRVAYVDMKGGHTLDLFGLLHLIRFGLPTSVSPLWKSSSTRTPSRSSMTSSRRSTEGPEDTARSVRLRSGVRRRMEPVPNCLSTFTEGSCGRRGHQRTRMVRRW